MFDLEQYEREARQVFREIDQRQLNSNFVITKELSCNCGQKHVVRFYFDTEQQVQNFIEQANRSRERILAVHQKLAGY